MKRGNVEGKDPPEKKKRKGSNKGKTLKTLDRNSQLMFVKKFLNNQQRWKSVRAYLNSPDSDPLSHEDASKFGRWKKAYETGKLTNTVGFRQRSSPFDTVEEKLLEYIYAKQEKCKIDKVGLNWSLIQVKAIQIWEDLARDNPDAKGTNFRASPGWLDKFLKRNNIILKDLHAEGGEITEEELEKCRKDCQAEIQTVCDKYNIKLCHITNAGQTGLFYNQLPKRMFFRDDQEMQSDGSNQPRGNKQMKSKDRLTLMTCIGADGHKYPLHAVGKPKMPVAVRVFNKGKFPIPYSWQKKAWFDKEIMMEWVLDVFWPAFKKRHGPVHCVLLLDNVSACKGIDKDPRLPKYIHIIFFPPNCKSFLEPADQGIIACLKVGYKALMLIILLDICINDEKYAKVIKQAETMKPGTKGIYQAQKANILDALNLVKTVWEHDDKYCTPEGIKRCWIKANILPPTMNADINNDIGPSPKVGTGKIPREQFDFLCKLVSSLHLKASEGRDALVDIKLGEEADNMNRQYFRERVKKWALLEDDEEVQKMIVDEIIEDLGKTTKSEEHEEASADVDVDGVAIDQDETNTALSASMVPNSWSAVQSAIDILGDYLQQQDMGNDAEYVRNLTLRILQKRQQSEQNTLFQFFFT